MENTKTSQAAEITKLKERAKKLERRNNSRTIGLKRLRKVRKIADIDADEEVTLIDETHERNDDNLMFDIGVLDEQEVEVEKTLIEIKVAKPKAVTTAATITIIAVTRPKAKGVVVQEPKELQAKLEEEERLAKQKEENANIVEWDNVQAIKDADYELARRKTPTKAQKRSLMCTYLKHMAGYKQNQLKSKKYDEIQKLFDKYMTRVNMFEDMDTELVKECSKKAEMVQESSSKRAREELESDNSKKQKLDENVEAEVDDEAGMKKHIEIVFTKVISR
ncbi:hypothetical protein Tco_1278986 [Tanacetum coccineum]